jgi:hypothetical protein
LPRQNRVTPFGEFEATSARGLLMGNRGILHDDQGRLGTARWQHKNWVACALSFKNRRRTIMAPGRYTELFFCDEPVSLAAGHRPCSECRREDFLRFMGAWQEAHGLSSGPLKTGEVDGALHQARVTRDKRQIRVPGHLGDLPDGTFVTLPDEEGSWLVWRDHLHRWSHEGYHDHRPATEGQAVIVLTPEPTVRVLGAGYEPVVHPSARV